MIAAGLYSKYAVNQLAIIPVVRDEGAHVHTIYYLVLSAKNLERLIFRTIVCANFNAPSVAGQKAVNCLDAL